MGYLMGSSEDHGTSTKEALVFAAKIARAMDTLRSSNVFFILQQAYPENDDWGWDEFGSLLSSVIEQTEGIVNRRS